MLKKTLGTVVFAACIAATATAQAAPVAAYIHGNGSVGAGDASVVLDGVLYTVTFKRTVSSSAFCAPEVTPNVGQFGVGSARVINHAPLQVNVIMMDGAGNGITGPDFYVKVTCAKPF